MANDRTAGERRLALEALLRHPGQASRLLEDAPREESLVLLAALSTEGAVAVVTALSPDTASGLLADVPDDGARRILTALNPARAAALLSRMDETVREQRLGLLDPRTAGELRSLASYPSDTAGALMDPRVMAVRPETTVEQALVRLRGFREKRIRRIFVIDSDGRPVGLVRLQDVAMASPSEELRELMKPDPVTVRDTAGREEIVEILTATRLPALPVVNFDGRLIGVIRDDILLDAAQAEATADLQTMVGA